MDNMMMYTVLIMGLLSFRECLRAKLSLKTVSGS
jgi:hypothetical protein